MLIAWLIDGTAGDDINVPQIVAAKGETGDLLNRNCYAPVEFAIRCIADDRTFPDGGDPYTTCRSRSLYRSSRTA
jgi:hypothetical protein